MNFFGSCPASSRSVLHSDTVRGRMAPARTASFRVGAAMISLMISSLNWKNGGSFWSRNTGSEYS
eukprot:1131471-Prymnesium_polylepis.1